jgi:2-polyprenyl-3-methyl-5-hydroxy-6-metoxy-1,4-benzoquinol methylase
MYRRNHYKIALIKTCPNCNSSLFLAYKLDHNVFECKSCKLQLAEGASFNLCFESSLNENIRETALKGVRLHNYQIIIEAIESYLPKKQLTGLEIGCSYGWFLDLCRSNQITCKGIEPEINFNSIYEERGYQVINGFYPEVLTNNEEYDFIIFNDVIEHIPDINAVMTANRNHIKQSGLLIINLPIQNGLFHLISSFFYHFGIKSFLNRMWQFDFHSPHLYYFTKQNLIHLAQKEGFEILNIKALRVLDTTQIRNRIGLDHSISSFKLKILTFLTYIIVPFTKIKPDVYCFFFEKK